MMTSLFDVDKEGLAKIAGRRSKAFVLYELLQNSWDADRCTRVRVDMIPRPGSPYVDVVVEDDSPDGFLDLRHAWTLFAESGKKGNPEKRGRFNLGEKLVVACCREAEILTTTGGVRFDSGGRHLLRQKREAGSVFRGEVRMTRAEYEEVCRLVRNVLPPDGIETFFNGELLLSVSPVGEESLMLETEISDDEGYLRRVPRRARIHIYEPRSGTSAHLYEMGIPVMELEGDRWSVDVAQKVPLSLDRDGVRPSYLRQIRAAVVNTMAHDISREDAGSDWVKDALQSPLVVEQAVRQVLDEGFGPKRVTYDPSDREANAIAMAEGYTVIPAAAFSAAAWDNVRRYQASRPAGQVTPSPKPFSPDGESLRTIDPGKWTDGMRAVVGYAREMACHVLKRSITVVIVNDVGWPHAGAFGPSGPLYLNVGQLGHGWFDGRKGAEAVDRLLIHEFAHGREGASHLSSDFYDECCRVGAAMKSVALVDPGACKIW